MKKRALKTLLCGSLVASLGISLASAADAPQAPASAREDLQPAVNTSAPPARSATQPATRSATAAAPPASTTAPAAGNARPRSGARDRIELDTTQITGNSELPRVLYVVPWKRSDLGDLTGKPVNSLLDEVLAPVDRDVFRRQNSYYDALKPDTATRGIAGGSEVEK